MDGCDVAQEGEQAATARTGMWLGLGKFRLRFGIGPEMEADGLQAAGGRGTHEPVVPHAREAFGQDVDQPAADELVGMEGEDAGFFRLAACPMEADAAALVVADDPPGADGAAFDVTGEVADGGVAAPDVLELDDPCFGGQEGGLGFGREGFVNLRVIVLEG